MKLQMGGAVSLSLTQAKAELKRFTKRRTQIVQELGASGPPDLISGDLLHGLFSRETNHRNIVGGGYFDPEKATPSNPKGWVTTGVDRGLGQLNEEYHGLWLESVWGCDSGTYTPEYPPKDRGGEGARAEGRVPGLTRGTERVIAVLQGNVIRAHNRSVPWTHALFVALCGYNRGVDSAVNAYKQGGKELAEEGTTGGDYATDILQRRSLFGQARRSLGW